jgi:hypothetical protein
MPSSVRIVFLQRLMGLCSSINDNPTNTNLIIQEMVGLLDEEIFKERLKDAEYKKNSSNIGKMRFVEVVYNREYYVFEDDLQIYDVVRNPIEWQAFDMNGKQIFEGSINRDDLFQKIVNLHSGI